MVTIWNALIHHQVSLRFHYNLWFTHYPYTTDSSVYLEEINHFSFHHRIRSENVQQSLSGSFFIRMLLRRVDEPKAERLLDFPPPLPLFVTCVIFHEDILSKSRIVRCIARLKVNAYSLEKLPKKEKGRQRIYF